jgi:hypothetical protein
LSRAQHRNDAGEPGRGHHPVVYTISAAHRAAGLG